MRSYNDSDLSIKFFNVSKDGPELGRRAIAIYHQILNGLDIPQKFHEAAIALLVAHRWEYNSGFQELTMMKIARAITTLNGGSHEKVYNRLKQNIPSFIDFLVDNQIDLFEVEKGQGTREANKYKFNYYKDVADLFELPLGTSQSKIREATDRLVMKIRGKRVDVKPRRKKERTPDDWENMIARAIAGAATVDKPAGHIAVEVIEKLELMGVDEDRVRDIIKMLAATY